MKIAILKKDFLGIGGGGAENYAQNICSALINRGHELYILSERFDAEEREGLIHIPVPKSNLFSTSGTMSFHKKVQKVLLTTKKKYNFNIVYALSRTYPVDVFRVTEQVHIEWMKIGYSRLQFLNSRHRGILKLEKKICSSLNTKTIITNSLMAKKQVMANYFFPEDSIKVIRNGIDRKKYYTVADEFEKKMIRERYSLKKDLISKFILLFVATNYKIKGLKYAIETLSKLDQKTKDNSVLLVIGEDNPSSYIKQAKLCGIENNILFFGQKDDLRDFYVTSDLLFFPSLGEPFANICLEAFACGLPVLTTALNGSSEIVSDGTNGYVVPSPFDTGEMVSRITEYYNLKPSEKTAFSASAHNTSISYSWNKHVDQLEDLFESKLKAISLLKKGQIPNISDITYKIINKPKSIRENKFSILIPTWNNIEYFKLCIKSIRKNSHFKHQIIVHVNDGSDGTLDWLSNEDVFVTHSKNNIGICWSLNGMRSLVETEYIVYMNDDMYVCPDWDLELWKEIKSLPDNKFYFSSTMIQPRPFFCKSVISSANYGQSIDDFDEKRLLKDYQTHEHKDWEGATWPPNIVHRDMWDLVGGYSIDFSPGLYSDPDFSAKLWMAGVRLFKGINKSRVFHFEARSTSRIKKNDGSSQFLYKWYITSSTFLGEILHRGIPYPVEQKYKRLTLRNVIRNRLKRPLIALYKPAKIKDIWKD